ncbi:hypothetical protein [Mangrovicoccus algicola]|uniref:DNA-binding protein n=1 Tax=Mangrovicoccus algicola TaxID=2771008 RepID=A0A8J6Z845_9RHOB|nr:hypothetical protein [Mangrovicoccus algicola]MBE3637571.1 hypothetical protein [Mangrovicoccus algicola]
MPPIPAPQDHLDATLRQHGFRAGSGAFLSALDEALDAVRPPRPARLSGAEQAALASVGAFPAAADEGPGLQAAALRMALLEESLGVAEAARLCGVRDSRIRQRLIEGSLLGLRAVSGRDAWRLPALQFEAGRELPGLARVLKARPGAADPLAAARFLITPQPDLETGSGGAMTPRDWLILGGDPAAVAALFAQI